MDRDRAARPSPGAEPSRDQRRCPEQALQAARDGRDESAWSWVGEDDDRARAHGDKLDRLAADVDLHTRLALVGFTGPEYAEFQTELTRYGLDVMTGWLRTGKIFAKMQQAGYGLPRPPEGVLDHDAQDELAGETVTVALARFHHDVLLRTLGPTQGRPADHVLRRPVQDPLRQHLPGVAGQGAAQHAAG